MAGWRHARRTTAPDDDLDQTADQPLDLPASRDIAEVPAIEIVSTAALHLMSAAAVNLGLAEDLPEHTDLDEARTLIDALAGLVVTAAPRLGHHHAAPAARRAAHPAARLPGGVVHPGRAR